MQAESIELWQWQQALACLVYGGRLEQPQPWPGGVVHNEKQLLAQLRLHCARIVGKALVMQSRDGLGGGRRGRYAGNREGLVRNGLEVSLDVVSGGRRGRKRRGPGLLWRAHWCCTS